jgi:Fe-S cluster assembly protein SufD
VNATVPSDARRRAWEDFERLPRPTTEDEAWRRTDVSGLDLSGCRLREDGAAFSGVLPAQGRDLSEALADDARARDLCGTVVPQGHNTFTALNAALWDQGVYIRVPRGTDAGLLRLDFSLAGSAVYPRVLLVLEPGAKAALWETYSSPPDARGLCVSTVEMVLEENSELSWVNTQSWGTGVDHFLIHNARLGAGARLTALAAALGGNLSKVDFGTELLAPGAESRLYGLVFGDGNQRFTHQVRQDHRAPHTTSDLLFKAALQGKARSIFTGHIRIEKNARGASAYQANKNILLSPFARANAIPNLEILTDDVRCGHGAAVGSLDEDQRFYLMSRGLDHDAAERVIVEGFFEEVIQRLPVPGLGDSLRSAVDRKLGV